MLEHFVAAPAVYLGIGYKKLYDHGRIYEVVLRVQPFQNEFFTALQA